MAFIEVTEMTYHGDRATPGNKKIINTEHIMTIGPGRFDRPL